MHLLIENINRIRRLKEHLRRLAEDNNIIPREVEEETNQINQVMTVNGERQLVMTKYARPINGTVVSCIQLGEVAHNYKLKNVHFTMMPSFYGIPNEDPLIFIKDFYAMVQTFPITRFYRGLVENEIFPIHFEEQSQVVAHDPSTKFIDNMGNNLQSIYSKFLFP